MKYIGIDHDSYLEHHGVKGMKWGQRKVRKWSDKKVRKWATARNQPSSVHSSSLAGSYFARRQWGLPVKSLERKLDRSNDLDAILWEAAKAEYVRRKTVH